MLPHCQLITIAQHKVESGTSTILHQHSWRNIQPSAPAESIDFLQPGPRAALVYCLTYLVSVSWLIYSCQLFPDVAVEATALVGLLIPRTACRFYFSHLAIGQFCHS